MTTATIEQTSTDQLFNRFDTELAEWHLRVYGFPVNDTYALICDPTSYYGVDATLADFRANPTQYTEYMRDWLDIDAA
jgi:hypothetical protein